VGPRRRRRRAKPRSVHPSDWVDIVGEGCSGAFDLGTHAVSPLSEVLAGVVRWLSRDAYALHYSNRPRRRRRRRQTPNVANQGSALLAIGTYACPTGPDALPPPPDAPKFSSPLRGGRGPTCRGPTPPLAPRGSTGRWYAAERGWVAEGRTRCGPVVARCGGAPRGSASKRRAVGHPGVAWTGFRSERNPLRLLQSQRTQESERRGA
jgi:hypothetical protein